MELTNEVVEMWEADARRGCRDGTMANARILKLIGMHREDTTMLADLTSRLCEVDPKFAAAIEVSLGRAA